MTHVQRIPPIDKVNLILKKWNIWDIFGEPLKRKELIVKLVLF